MTNFNPSLIPELETAELRNALNALATRASQLSAEELRTGIKIMIELRSRARSTPRGKAPATVVTPLSLDEL